MKRKYNIGGVIGGLIGQGLIPIPGVGAGIGRIAGDFLAKKISPFFKNRRQQRQENILEEWDRNANIYYPSSSGMNLNTMGNGGPIRIRPENKGKFTAAANRAGMGVQAYARKVLADPNASGTLKKRANFARNAAKWHKAFGGPIEDYMNFGGPIEDYMEMGGYTRKKKKKYIPPQQGGKIVPPGGSLTALGNGGAVKVRGPKHKNGGVQLTPNVEVEGGETMAMVHGQPFVFSDRLNVPGTGKTFADVHEDAEESGVGQRFRDDLADTQETMKVQKGVGQKFREEKYPLGGFLDKTVGFFKDNPNLINPLVNVGAGLLKVNKPMRLPRVSRSAENTLRGLPTTFNVEPQLEEQRQAFRTLASNPAVGGNTNRLLAAHVGSLKNRNQLLGEKENRENALKSQKVSAIADAQARADAMDLEQGTLEAHDKARARAANTNLILSGIGGVGRAAQQAKIDQIMKDAEPMQLAAMLAGTDGEVNTELLGRIASMSDPDRFADILEALRAYRRGNQGTSNSSMKAVPNVSPVGPNDGFSLRRNLIVP